MSRSLTAGEQIYCLLERLFPVCRSITGDGVRETLRILQEVVPEIEMYEVPSGTVVFDWEVPLEWNIIDAYIDDLDGNRIISFAENNLHVMGYSAPIDEIMTRDELLNIVYTLPEQPNVIPYLTSYYKERIGFCMSEVQKESLTESHYRVVIDSSHTVGSLTYGELLIPGAEDKEVFISSYVCHPSMANNELSGPCIATYLSKWLLERDRRYTYRIVFIPETIGSLTYLSRNLEEMKSSIIAGFNLSCLGDERAWSFIRTRYGDSLTDRLLSRLFDEMDSTNKTVYSYLERGSDERQYCAPGIDLPVCTVCRSKFGEYPEYHTSDDNLNMVSAKGLGESLAFLQTAIEFLEANRTYQVSTFGEPQLGKRGLYPTLSTTNTKNQVANMMNILAYADGTNDLIDIATIADIPTKDLIDTADRLHRAGLLQDLSNVHNDVIGGESACNMYYTR